MSRVCVLVADSVGIGALPDGDIGSDTLGHIIRECPELRIPNLLMLGMANIAGVSFANLKTDAPKAAYGRAKEEFTGKDTTGGHWEIAGLVLESPFPTYPQGFPQPVLDELSQRTGRGIMGNCTASGTEIINRLGDEQVETGKLIVYTSADSVFQIAMHEEIIPLSEQHKIGEIARGIMTGENSVGRIILRPFLGANGDYARTTNRKDYSLAPPGDTMLDAIKAAGMEVAAVGKIEDIFANRGMTMINHTRTNQSGIDATLDYLKQDFSGLIFTNLVDFDTNFGHRNDTDGYAKALEQLDARLPELMSALREDDLLIITADHGCDPTFPGTDHTREYIPIIAYGHSVKPGADIGTRSTFADIAATTIEWLGLPKWGIGRSFLKEITG